MVSECNPRPYANASDGPSTLPSMPHHFGQAHEEPIPGLDTTNKAQSDSVSTAAVVRDEVSAQQVPVKLGHVEATGAEIPPGKQDQEGVGRGYAKHRARKTFPPPSCQRSGMMSISRRGRESSV